MKARKSVLVVLAFLPYPYLIGQINCATGSPDYSKLVCQLPVTTTNLTAVPNDAAIQAAAQQNSAAVNAAIGSQLSQLPIPSVVSGTVTLREKGTPVPYDNLGPILTDRPDTIGKGKLFSGFSYQHFDFNAINGINTGSLPFGYAATVAQAGAPAFRTTFGSNNNTIDFKLDQYVALFTYGASPTTDVSLVLPFESVSINATSSSPQAYSYDSSTNTYQQVQFAAAPPVQTQGSASGLGDLQFGVKQLIHGQEGNKTAVALGATVRLPTGDQLNYLGSGAYGFNAYGLFSYRARFSPHLKLGNQWNGPSQLVNTTVPNTHGEKNLPGGIQYAVGFDYRIKRTLTFASDILGSQFVNAPSLTESTGIVLNPAPSLTYNPPPGIPGSLQAATPTSTSYTTVNFSAGFKYLPIPQLPGLLIYGNVLIQLNNVGLRSNPVPLGGIAYNFKLKR